MGATTTVIFADLTGSTGVFETLGNEAATQTITALTRWIGDICEAHGGRVVKTLGDGVLALFPRAEPAILAVVQMQREHARRQMQRGPAHRMQLQVGMASGEVVEVDGDCYGDAVNVAARLSDLSGARQVWATRSATDQLRLPPAGTRFHALGAVPIRGKAQELPVVRIEWEEGISTDMMTLPSGGASLPGGRGAQGAEATITLRCLDLEHSFAAGELPVHMGRAREAEFPVSDPRVSRLHARIEWRNNAFVLVDLSSFGCCVRFQGAATELTLRRDECVLHGSGEIALAADFGDWSVPTIQFELQLRK